MPRPVTLFTGQWADLPVDTMISKAKSFGYDGVELACWGDHFEVAKADQSYCDALRANPTWEFGDYEPEVGKPLWKWAAKTSSGFRQIIDTRLALTLRHHGVTHFATANAKHFEGFGFEKVWSPVAGA